MLLCARSTAGLDFMLEFIISKAHTVNREAPKSSSDGINPTHRVIVDIRLIVWASFMNIRAASCVKRATTTDVLYNIAFFYFFFRSFRVSSKCWSRFAVSRTCIEQIRFYAKMETDRFFSLSLFFFFPGVSSVSSRALP